MTVTDSITAKVGRRGQLTLPRAIRRRLDVKEGQRVAFIIEGGQVTMYPLNQTVFDLRGSVEVEGPQDFDSIRKTVREKVAKEKAEAGRDSDT
jgi:AbrB family looped-hinge helix DNA binding protein